MYRILSIEDSPEQEAILREHIARYAAETGLDLRLTWEQSAFDLAELSHGFDLVFLDIDLPGINGMEAAAAMRERNPETPLVFVTNLAQYALKGYEVDALDFVVKPVGYYDFKMRMDKAIRVIERRGGKRLTVVVDGELRVLDASDLAFVDVTNHDLTYHLADGEVLVTRGTLSRLEGELPNSSFVRASKSCLVNMAHIKRIKGADLLMDTGDTVFLSRSQKKTALETIARYLGGSL